MSRVIGIDIRTGHVRAVLVRLGYRRPAIERMVEVSRSTTETLRQAIQACVVPIAQHGEAVAVAVSAERAFIHRIVLPGSARKQLAEVLPFEIEAQVPIEMDELVFDYRVLPQVKGDDTITAITASARTETVRELIELTQEAIGRGPDRVGCGPLPLGNLCTVSKALADPGPIALVDLGGEISEVAIVAGGEPVLARTLSRGMASLPEGAPQLAAELRQTLAAWTVHGNAPVGRVVLLGSGATDPNAPAYLSYMLGVPAEPLQDLEVDGLDPETRTQLPQYAKALALALSLGSRPRDPDLRQGQLTFHRGYEFLKEKLPLLSGLVGAIVISLVFATWAEMRALGREQAALESALATVTREILDEETSDPDRVIELLQPNASKVASDPMPYADAFDVMVELSEGIPMDLTHDVEELDFRKRHAKLKGIVVSKTDAQRVADIVKKWECAKGVSLGKITQVVNDDKQKYTLDFDLQCPLDADPKARKKPKAEGQEKDPAKAENQEAEE